MIEIHLWEIPLFSFGGILIFRLIMAPYWIWKKDQQKIDDLQKKVETSKSLSAADHENAELARVRIENEKTEHGMKMYKILQGKDKSD